METHRTILAAAADLLESAAYRDISVERIAAEAGVGKQTIYRWYDCKADLMLDAFLTRYTESLPPVVLGGDALANLRTYLHQIVRLLPSRSFDAAYRALFAEAQLDGNFRQRFSEIVLEKRRDFARVFVITAIHKKQIREDVDPDTVIDMLLSPLLMRFLTGLTPPDEAFADQILDAVLHGLAAKVPALIEA